MFVAIPSSSSTLGTSECPTHAFVTLTKPFSSFVHRFAPPACSGESGGLDLFFLRVPTAWLVFLSVLMLLDALGMSLYFLGISVWLPTSPNAVCVVTRQLNTPCACAWSLDASARTLAALLSPHSSIDVVSSTVDLFAVSARPTGPYYQSYLTTSLHAYPM